MAKIIAILLITVSGYTALAHGVQSLQQDREIASQTYRG